MASSSIATQGYLLLIQDQFWQVTKAFMLVFPSDLSAVCIATTFSFRKAQALVHVPNQ